MHGINLFSNSGGSKKSRLDLYSLLILEEIGDLSLRLDFLQPLGKEGTQHSLGSKDTT